MQMDGVDKNYGCYAHIYCTNRNLKGIQGDHRERCLEFNCKESIGPKGTIMCNNFLKEC